VTSPAETPAADPRRTVDPYSKWLHYGSSAVCLAACVVGAFLVGQGWSWGLFIWGAAVAFGSVVATLLIRRLALSRVADGGQAASLRSQRMRERDLTIFPPAVFSLLGVAIFGAATLSPWPDVVITAIAVLAVLVPAALLPAIVRRARGTDLPSAE